MMAAGVGAMMTDFKHAVAGDFTHKRQLLGTRDV